MNWSLFLKIECCDNSIKILSSKLKIKQVLDNMHFNLGRLILVIKITIYDIYVSIVRPV